MAPRTPRTKQPQNAAHAAALARREQGNRTLRTVTRWLIGGSVAGALALTGLFAAQATTSTTSTTSTAGAASAPAPGASPAASAGAQAATPTTPSRSATAAASASAAPQRRAVTRSHAS